MSNWFYIIGSLCFLIGTILNMLLASPARAPRDTDKMSNVVKTMRDADWKRRGYGFDRGDSQ